MAKLRTPRALSEISVTKPGDDRDKPLARQTVKRHLDRLVEAGAVRAREAEREYGTTTEYLLDNRRLFALSERFRGLAELRPAEDPDADTLRGDRSLGGADPAGSHLVLVKGVREGEVYPLEGGEAAEPPWVIGRRRGLAVPLDFDPFVSAENAVVERDGDRFVVSDLPQSRNGTTVNGRELGPDERWTLEPGDLVGVGKSTLVFRL